MSTIHNEGLPVTVDRLPQPKITGTGSKVHRFFTQAKEKMSSTFTSENVARAAMGFAKKVDSTRKKITSAARATKAFVTSKKTRAFLQKGAIGKAVGIGTGLGVAEVTAGLVGGWLASFPSSAIGETVGGLAGYAIVPIVVAAGVSQISKVAPQIRHLLLTKGFITIMIVFALMAQLQYGEALKEHGEAAGRDVFTFLGSTLASIIAGYQISQLSSGLSFEEYAQRNLQQIVAVQTLDFVSPSSLFRIPRNLVLGMAAYNAIPLYNLIQTVRCILNSEGKDVALKLKLFIENTQKQKLADALKARTDAAQKGEDLSVHDKSIAELQNQSGALHTIFANLDKFFRIGFTKFNDYQKMLTESSDIGAAQAKLITTYKQAGNFESQLVEGGLLSTDDYKDALTRNPLSVQNSENFIAMRRKHYQFEKEQAKYSLTSHLSQAVHQKQGFGAHLLQNVLAPVSRNFVLPQLENLPDIQKIETDYLGFAITSDAHAEITKELLSIHLHSFVSFAGSTVAAELLHAFLPTAMTTTFGVKSSSEALLEKNEELQLAEGLITLALGHYERIAPTSSTIAGVQTTVHALFTSLKEGPRAALAEWRTSTNEGVMVEEMEDEGAEDYQNFTEISTVDPDLTNADVDPYADFTVVERESDHTIVNMNYSPTPSNSSSEVTTETPVDDFVLVNIDEAP